MTTSTSMLSTVYSSCKNNETDYVLSAESVIFLALLCSFPCKEKLGVVLGAKC